MLDNTRKDRLFAFSSSVFWKANPPGKTLRARRIWFLSALESLENHKVTCAFPPSQEPVPLRRMDAVNEFMT